MDIKEIALSLSNNEKKVLNAIKGNSDVSKIKEATKLDEISIKRAFQWLENKKLIEINKQKVKSITYGKNGVKYSKEELPETKLLKILLKGPKKLEDIPLEKDEINVSIGLLKRKGAISIKEKTLEITEVGKKLLEKPSLEEQFLKSLPKKFDELKPEEVYAYNNLLKRKDIIQVVDEEKINCRITPLGEKVRKEKTEEMIERLTKEVLLKKEWQRKRFRYYDIKSKTPAIYGGKKHILYQAIEYIKRIWLDLGFKEMQGNLIQTSFWNFDALFTPQDHPVRELQDTFYIKEKGELPKELAKKVKAVHEDGWTTGSKGWQYKWSEEEAKRYVLRTHTTCLSAHKLAELKEIPGKFFSVGKTFRNETLDWGHSFEFYQVEGIVVGEDVTFRQLLGYLKEYYKKLGFSKVRFRPAYFPYTEMSVEAEVFHPEKKTWMELGGAGIFRPEVVKPLLGKDIPVLAWGQGLERGVMEYIGINDLRKIYSNDLDMLKKMKVWFKCQK